MKGMKDDKKNCNSFRSMHYISIFYIYVSLALNRYIIRFTANINWKYTTNNTNKKLYKVTKKAIIHSLKLKYTQFSNGGFVVLPK